ncbi:methyltransferase domain-containing protein [Streptomyces sp. MUM 203J]|uniref:class I SAM-dependent methyltransferase n=1 Tax=Streptomyces sp. MUM 203J TaxID=2791990 RepID=UPI001F035B94|nr:methyltransferase domain-containing protein [Streptomyces sp. MUM 203J]MCH0539222.1 methyltransferase domain-containing protein [Streptomyces sp. MUM 203J]
MSDDHTDVQTARRDQAIHEVQEFFTERAADWDSRFPDDGPAYAAAVADMGLRPGGAVLDAGCGTGRALPALREAVGPSGTVVGLDVTPAMLAAAVRAGRDGSGRLLLGDVGRLPLRDGALDGVFGAGLVSHLGQPAEGLRELARVVRPGGRLALFHPVGRAALAARHGRPVTDDDLRAEPRLRPLLAASGWRMISYEDVDARFLVLADRED